MAGKILNIDGTKQKAGEVATLEENFHTTLYLHHVMSKETPNTITDKLYMDMLTPNTLKPILPTGTGKELYVKAASLKLTFGEPVKLAQPEIANSVDRILAAKLNAVYTPIQPGIFKSPEFKNRLKKKSVDDIIVEFSDRSVMQDAIEMYRMSLNKTWTPGSPFSR